MKIYAMDRNFYELKLYENFLSKSSIKLHCFSYLSQLKNEIERDEPDIVFIESELFNLCDFVEEYQKLYPKIKFIFVGEEILAEQLNIQPDGWTNKPITEEKINRELFKFKHPLLSKSVFKTKVTQ